MSVQINKEKTKQILSLVLDKIRTEVDPFLLEEYHRLFKKEISLFHRTKAAAYLLMLCEQGKMPHLDKPRKGREEVAVPAGRETTRLAEEESIRLFFSVGRNRRIFPRDIIGLINAQISIPREDIGNIRILDNYSFVQVRDTMAEKIIEALNGKEFRGRPLTVNYAKSRSEEDSSEQD